MDNEFEALLAGVRWGNDAWAKNIAENKPVVKPEQERIFKIGQNLAEAKHWVSTADTQHELAQDEAQYDAVANYINSYFGKKVAELHSEGSREPGFINPAGERIGFYG